MAAKETRLGSLHELVAETFIRQLENPEAITPALLSAATKFLKDNGIEAELGDEQMEQLKESMGNVTNFPFNPKTAVEE